MATYYVDPAASGSNTGADWTNAWTSMASAISTAAAGDTVYMRGTQTLSANMDFSASGTPAGGFIKFIGCNAAGNVDGTRFKLNCNSGARSLRYMNQDYIWLQNVEVYASTGNGIALNSGQQNGVFINVLSRDNGGDGWYGYYYGDGLFINCGATGNTGDGFDAIYKPSYFVGCYSFDNGGDGYVSSSNGEMQTFVNCLACNNGLDGFNTRWLKVAFYGCVADNNDDNGISGDDNLVMVLGCRITNNGNDGSGYGLSLLADKLGVYGWNFFNGNQDGITSGNWNAIGYKDNADTNETSGTEGYTDASNGDYNLTTDATLRSVEVELE